MNTNNFFKKKGIKPSLTIKYNRWDPNEFPILNYDNFGEDFTIGNMMFRTKTLINTILYVLFIIILIIVIILINKY